MHKNLFDCLITLPTVLKQYKIIYNFACAYTTIFDTCIHTIEIKSKSNKFLCIVCNKEEKCQIKNLK